MIGNIITCNCFCLVIEYGTTKKEGEPMEKNPVLKNESDDLGQVIKNLIDFDSQQRELISDALAQRTEKRKELEAQKSKINEEYMRKAEKVLKDIEKKENEKADMEIEKIRKMSKKNIRELQKRTIEYNKFWVSRIFELVINEE